MNINRKALVFELLMKTAAAAALAYFAYSVYQSWLHTHNPTTLLLLAGECLTVFLVVFSKFTDTRDLSPMSLLATAGATFYFFAISLDGGIKLIPDGAASALLVSGITWQIYAKIYLGRSFGLLPACRTVVDSGPYRLVRHPIYFGYFIGHLAFLLNNFSLWNLAVLTLLYLLQCLRMTYEERVLSRNEQYREYKTRVTKRFIPFLI